MANQTKANESTASASSAAVDPKLVGIGGWLILPAIGLVLGSIIGVVALIAAFALFPDVSRAGYAGIYTFELVVQVWLLGYLLYVATLFFRKKKNAPSAIIKYLFVSLGALVVLFVIEIGSGAEEFAMETGKQLFRNVIAAAIWIPYFRESKRVKATFVK